MGLRELAPGYRIGVGRVSYARVPAMRIGALSLRDIVVEVQQGLTQAGAIDVVGSLGYDFLASVGLTIDYPTRRVSAVPPRAYVAPDGVAAYHLSVRSGGGIPMTTATINGTRTERMAVNTMAFPLATVFDAFELVSSERRRSRLYTVCNLGARPWPVAIRTIHRAACEYADSVRHH